MNNQVNINMKPQDIVVLLQIIASKEDWVQASLAEKLCMSQSEISQSIARSKFSGLLDPTGKKVRTEALHEFLEYGVSYTFPVKPGPFCLSTKRTDTE
jgi:DNA-binding transcriptional regulator LsrR (DeoR family)